MQEYNFKILIKNFIFIILVSAGIFVSIIGCENPLETGYFDPRIMITDANGNILGGDTTAWCKTTNPSYTIFAVQFAYPNPTKDGKTQIYVINNQDVRMTLYFEDGNIAYNSNYGYNFYTFLIDGRKFDYKNTVKKLYIKTSAGQECSGYIQFD